MPQQRLEVNIKYLLCFSLFFLAALVPTQLTASVRPDQQELVIHNPHTVVIEVPVPPPVKKIVPIKKVATPTVVVQTNRKYGRYECVRYVKDIVGVYGTWGNGARGLSRNSTGQVGDVAIFAGIVHAGYVIGREGDQVTVKSWMTSKKGTWEEIRTFPVKSFLGFHKF